MIVSKRYGAIFLLSLLYFFLLEYAYQVVLFEDYGYLGFKHEPVFWKVYFSKVVYLAISIFILIFFRGFLFSFFQVYNCVFLAPNLILFGAMDSTPLILIGITIIPVVVLFLSKVKLNPPKIELNRSQQLLALTFLVLGMFFVFPLTYGVNIRPDLLLLSNVYDLRKEAASASNVLTAYFYSPLSTWFIPLLIIFSFKEKRYYLVMLGVLLQLYLFLSTGNKITLLILLVLLGFSVANGFLGKTKLLQVGLVSGLLLIVALPNNQLSIVVEDLLFRRFIFHPALLNIQYHEFFQEPLYYSYSFLSLFSEYRYPLPPPQMIGMHYYESSEGNMTNGIIGDALINLGFWGVLLIPLLCAMLVTYFYKLKTSPIYFPLFFLLIQSFIDAPFFTSILTHGILLFVIVATVIMKNTDGNER